MYAGGSYEGAGVGCLGAHWGVMLVAIVRVLVGVMGAGWVRCG